MKLVLCAMLICLFIPMAGAQFIGDVNWDNDLTPADAVRSFQIFLGSYTDTHFDDQVTDTELADYDGNGQVTPYDALCIFRAYLGLVNSDVPGLIYVNCADEADLQTMQYVALDHERAVILGTISIKPVGEDVVINQLGFTLYGRAMAYADRVELSSVDSLGVKNTVRSFFSDGYAIFPMKELARHNQTLEYQVRLVLKPYMPTKDMEWLWLMPAAWVLDAVGLETGVSYTERRIRDSYFSGIFLNRAWPCLYVAPDSPAGTLESKLFCHVATFQIGACGSEDVTFDVNNNNLINFAVDMHQSGDGYLDQCELICLNEADEEIARSAVILQNYATDRVVEVPIYFYDTFTVPAGEVRELKILTDTRHLNQPGNSIQVSILTNKPNSIRWGVNGQGVYPEYNALNPIADVFGRQLVHP